MSEISEYINKNLNANIKQFIFLNMLDQEVDMDGTLVSFPTKEFSVERIFLNLNDKFFTLPVTGTNIDIYGIKNRDLNRDTYVSTDNYTLYMLQTNDTKDEIKKFIIDSIHSLVEKPNVLLLDVTHESRLNFNQTEGILLKIRDLDDFFISSKISRIYKLGNKYFIFN